MELRAAELKSNFRVALFCAPREKRRRGKIAVSAIWECLPDYVAAQVDFTEESSSDEYDRAFARILKSTGGLYDSLARVSELRLRTLFVRQLGDMFEEDLDQFGEVVYRSSKSFRNEQSAWSHLSSRVNAAAVRYAKSARCDGVLLWDEDARHRLSFVACTAAGSMAYEARAQEKFPK